MIWYVIGLLFVFFIFLAMKIVELKEMTDTLVSDCNEFVTYSDLQRFTSIENRRDRRSYSSEK